LQKKGEIEKNSPKHKAVPIERAMHRPLGEYQKNIIDGVLHKYGKYTVKRPIDKQTIRCLDSLVKRGLVAFGAKTETYRLKQKLESNSRAMADVKGGTNDSHPLHGSRG
jgi:hypothetical protein